MLLRLFIVAFGAALIAACGEPASNAPVQTQNDLCQNDFEICVMPVLTGQIRRSGGAVLTCIECHTEGGNGGRFTLGADNNANFLAARSLVNRLEPGDSLLLVEPTADGVAPSAVAGTHGGGDIFPTRSDACYTVIENWIANQVTEQTSPACGQCVPVADTFSSCGYP